MSIFIYHRAATAVDKDTMEIQQTAMDISIGK